MCDRPGAIGNSPFEKTGLHSCFVLGLNRENSVEQCRICTEQKAVALPVIRLPVRSYLRCEGCGSVYVKPEAHLTPEKEIEVYRLHENSYLDPRYCSYLAPILELAWDALSRRTSAGAHSVLDFGSGPIAESEESFVCRFFREKGCRAQAYDPYFRPGKLEKRSYDLIVACEVAEHFRDPAAEFRKISELLRDDGILVIQTALLPEIEHFDNWYYRRDPTHIAFYTPKAFAWLADQLGFDPPLIRDGKRVLLTGFRKPGFM